MTAPLRFVANGQPVEVADADGATLLSVLREDLGLRGARFGCGEGLCGVCAVLVDGRATLACSTPAAAVAGRAVTTLEGLAQGEALHPVQAAILARDAGQCGYCLSGIIIRVVALLAETPRATRGDIAAALEGHLCRCGAHGRILDAIEAAVEGRS